MNNKNIFLFLFIIIIIVKGQILSAQPLPQNTIFRHLNIDNGLSEASVYAVLQDREGFMWFGTQEGLNRYDGYKFTIYKYDPSVTFSISNSAIYCLYEDKDGNIWIGTEEGLNLYNKKTGKFKSFLHKADVPNSISNNKIVDIIEDQKGVLWVSTDGGGLCSLDKKSEAFTTYKNNPSDPTTISSDFVSSLFIDRENRMWVGTIGGGLNLYNEQTHKFTTFNGDIKHLEFDKQCKINCIFQDKAGSLWIGSERGLTHFDYHTGKFETLIYSLSDRKDKQLYPVKDLFEDSLGNLWLGTYGGGLNIMDPKSIGPKTLNIAQYKYDVNDQNSLSNNNICKMLRDKEQNLWIATYNGGVNLYNTNINRFKSYKKKQGDENSISGNTIIGLEATRDGMIWIGTWGEGLNMYDHVKNTFIVYKHDKSNPSSISNNIVNKMCEDKAGNLWVATVNGLNMFDRNKNIFTHYKHSESDIYSISNDEIIYVYIDKNDDLWCGSRKGGLSHFDKKNQRFYNYTNNPNNPNSISHNSVLYIYEDSRGTLWAGTWGGGLNAFDRKTNRFTVYKNVRGNPNSISDNIINSIYENKDGKLMIGTMGGLNIFDPNTGKFISYTEKNGLPNNVVYGISPDRKNNYWLSTNNGIACIKFENGKFYSKNYDEKDGLPWNEFNGLASCISPDGSMYFGGPNGLTAFHPDSIHNNLYIAPVYITDFQLFNKSVGINDPTQILKHDIAFSDTIILDYDQDVFSLQFATLNYINPEKNLYAYKMEGFDKDWNYTDATRRFATYTNLDPGTYIFKVKACNNDGIWNEKGKTICIIIRPPFFKTWWFISISFITLLSLIIWAVRIASVRKYKKRLVEMEHQREIESIRSRIARDIHDDIGAELTQITLLAELTKANEESGSRNFNSVEKLAISARAIIHNLGEIIWAINPKYDNLPGLLSYFSNHISNVFEESDISYHILFPDKVPDVLVNPDLRRNLFLVLKEALVNILKHSNATEVTVSFELKNNIYILKIEDNGTGIQQEKISTYGNGLKNMETRMKGVEGTLTVKSKIDTGTTIIASGNIF